MTSSSGWGENSRQTGASAATGGNTGMLCGTTGKPRPLSSSCSKAET
jgi:hypothetical protein